MGVCPSRARASSVMASGGYAAQSGSAAAAVEEPQPQRLVASAAACHGRCYGFEEQRNGWAAPEIVASSTAQARAGYDSMSASEYCDTQEVLRAKVRAMARLVRASERCIIFSGAGLSTAAGIGDYASSAADSASGAPNPLLGAQPASPFCAQPTLAHRVLVAMHTARPFHRWINQNHDGLPQKAGFPQESMNEIHGAWHAPDNPVIVMSGELRGDLFADLLECEQQTDLAIAIGTSICGMNADRVVTTPAKRAAAGEPGQLGSIVISLQQTVHDADSSLRIFARCDDVFALLAEELTLDVAAALPKGVYFTPAILEGRAEDDYVFRSLPYNAAGERNSNSSMTLDIREDSELVIPRGLHAGAVGVVDGFDREGNVRCRFKLKPKKGKLRAQVPLLLGRWWLQAAADGTVATLPVVNVPSEGAAGADEALSGLVELMQAYAT